MVARAGELCAGVGDIDAVRVELETRGDGNGLVDDRAGHDDELDAQTLRRRVALENAVGEGGLGGPEGCVAVEFEGNHLFAVRFRPPRPLPPTTTPPPPPPAPPQHPPTPLPAP